jgi:hypothetical protein
MNYQVPVHVTFRIVNDEVILLDGRTDRFFGLNTTASAIWLVLTDGGSIEAAIDSLITRYAVSPEQARADATVLAKQFVERELLTQVEG